MKMWKIQSRPTRTINEINDPVELVGLAEGEQFTVQVNDFEGASTVTIIGPNTVATPSIMVTVNDGGDDSGITFPPSEINPATFPLPTAADSNVTGTLTLTGSFEGEDFTLNAISNVGLATTNVMITLTFSDGRNPIPSTVTRTITINIVLDDIPPTIPDTRIGDPNDLDDPIVVGATQVTLGFNSAYDRVGSMADLDNAPFTRDVDYMITIMRMATDDRTKPMRKFPLMKMSASDLDIPSVDDPNSIPTSVTIKLTLDRNDVTLIPGDRYMVDISVTDEAGNPNTADNPDAAITYDTQTFIMLTEGAYEELDSLNIDCGTDSDSDGDGIASAYELFIGTDCTDLGEFDYVSSVVSVVSAEITVPLSPPDVYVVAAGASTYTQIDTGVKCTGDCNNLKAFIVSSGLGGSADADAASMVTDRCYPDNTSSNPNSCWVNDVSVDEDGNVRTIPLPLGYNLIDWVAADEHGNLPRNDANPRQVIKKHSLYM